MINREVKYERTIAGSYIKVPASYQGEFDEMMMLKKVLRGMIPVEKCFYNNEGQYWYNITGFQSLETKCQVKEIDYVLFEKLLFRICEQLEVLEMNLIAPESILLEPEYIFISNRTDEIRFMMYPGQGDDIMAQIRELMEYILQNVSHSDAQNVEKIYSIYGLILNQTSSVGDILLELEKNRQEKIMAEIQKEKDAQAIEYKDLNEENTECIAQETKVGKLKAKVRDKIETYIEKRKEQLCEWKVFFFKGKKKENARDHYKKKERYGKKDSYLLDTVNEDFEEEVWEPQEQTDYPTVCILTKPNQLKGILQYEGTGNGEDLVVGMDEVQIGKGANADIQIMDETISRIHARIIREMGEYYLEDMNSTNGTFLNGEMLSCKEKYKLNKNDKVQFANVNYRFV